MTKKTRDLTVLVRQMAINNAELAYVELFKELFEPLRKFSYSILKSAELAEEVASDVLFILWDKRKQLMDVKNVKHYAFIAAKNRSFNSLKQQTGKEVLSLDDVDMDIQLYSPSPEAIFIHGEMKIKLEQSIAKLPKQCKLIFQLVKEEGFSYKEVAELLGVSTKTVDAHLVNAMKKLSHLLKAEFRFA
ncbi:sigma-70 family RNA polymerase sigma factor [Olivibacter sp. SDN3]|uniref:RNA polymerase sigma factor n=1 Tax=Olivibacter sp. SDN3 TaxID=2764720 RepID=UPI0016514AD7|nr:sigma-70 family RNA polymerase sigma factor [Olivibacter sp. SDN3]QNL48666.1 sigma-70 family RNA polymerase sigma factor [Olivibacter sp. SDN3]